MNKIVKQGFIFTTTIVVLGALFRFIPHLPNFTPIAAMALFGGALYSNKWKALLIPMAILFVSDLILGFHATMIFVYVGFLVTVFIGMRIGKKAAFKNIFFSALLSSIVFFLLTNFGVWMMYDFYPNNFAGLIGTYAAGLPFFRNEVMGTLFYSGVFFGAYSIAKAKYPQLVTA
jgi:hypothetical protein